MDRKTKAFRVQIGGANDLYYYPMVAFIADGHVPTDCRTICRIKTNKYDVLLYITAADRMANLSLTLNHEKMSLFVQKAVNMVLKKRPELWES